MKNLLANPNRAALISLLISLPATTLLLSLLLGFESGLSPLAPLFYREHNLLGTFIFFGTFLIALAGFVLNLMLLVQNARLGKGLQANPLNLMLCALIFLFILTFVVALIIDQ